MSTFEFLLCLLIRPASGMIIAILFDAPHSQVNWSRLSGAGFRAVLLDKDNTITMPYARELHSSVDSALKDVVSVFGRQNVAIISNSAVRPGEEEKRREENGMEY